MKRKTNRGTLTLEQLKKMANVFGEITTDDIVFKRWKTPFLWILWFFIGYVVVSENWKTYWVNFRNVSYLIKSEELLEKGV